MILMNGSNVDSFNAVSTDDIPVRCSITKFGDGFGIS